MVVEIGNEIPPLEAAECSAAAVGAVDEPHGVDVARARLGRLQLELLEVEPHLQSQFRTLIDGSANTFSAIPGQSRPVHLIENILLRTGNL